MVSAKLLAFFSLQILGAFGLGNNLVADWPRINERLDWQHEKLKTLVDLLETLTEVGNVTLIGWQNVWNTDGSLREVKMIELTILKESLISPIWELIDFNILEEIPQVLNMMDTSGDATIVSSSLQQWSTTGNLQESLYIGGQDIYVLLDDGITVWYKNSTVHDWAQIERSTKQLKHDTRLGMSILKWNVDGTFNLGNSVIVPELLSSVLHATNATHEMLTTSILELSKAVLVHPEAVTKNMALNLKQTIPGYLWHVVEGDVDSFITSDVYMRLQFNPIDLLENDVIVDIYGAKI